jgi:hypothetical protein
MHSTNRMTMLGKSVWNGVALGSVLVCRLRAVVAYVVEQGCHDHRWCGSELSKNAGSSSEALSACGAVPSGSKCDSLLLPHPVYKPIDCLGSAGCCTQI